MVQLALTRGLGPRRIARLLQHFENAERVCSASAQELLRVDGFSSKLGQSVFEELQEAAALVDEELRIIEEYGVSLVSIEHQNYPPLLRQIQDPPPLLYLKGRIDPERDQLTVAIVGSRRCSHYGREQATRFAFGLAQSSITVVSGGARGIDTAAHRGAVQANGRTIVVLGSGLGRIYPSDNTKLFTEIGESGRGAVISEFPMMTSPEPKNFPIRNRVISGLSLGTLVIEASERSGALITARLACEDHNREVMILPGRIDSPTAAGCHRILKQGWGRLVTSVADVLEALEEAGSTHLLAASDQNNGPDSLFAHAPPERGQTAPAPARANQAVKTAGLTDSQRHIFESLDGEAVELDELAGRTGIEVARLQADLTVLQIRGLITRTTAGGINRR